MNRIALVLLLCSCAGYQPDGVKAHPKALDDDRRTIGCLDVSVSTIRDDKATGPVASFSLGNRCNAGVWVDLAAVRGTVRHPDGRVEDLVVFDPKGQIRPAMLEARSKAWEILEYHRPEAELPASPTGLLAINAELCLDLARIDRDEPSPLPVVVCLDFGPDAKQPFDPIRDGTALTEEIP